VYADPSTLLIDSARPLSSAAVVAVHNLGWPQAERL
jgi:hypothetical protein